MFAADVDRIRLWSSKLSVLKKFDREKDIAEINILFFLYMKYAGNMKLICSVTNCKSANQVRFSIFYIYL